MAGSAFQKWAGVCLCIAALLLVVINAGFTPRLPQGAFSGLAASEVFLWRQCLAAAAALFMTIGLIGLFAAQSQRVSFFGHLAFFIAFTGGMALFATEWAQIFLLRDMALHNPDALDQLENAAGPTLFDIGAIAAFSVFALGWVLMSISMALARVFARWSALLVLAAFLVTPALGAFGVWGAAAGSVAIGLGWFSLGVQLIRAR